MKYVANLLPNSSKFFQDKHNQKIIVISVFVAVFLCTLILLTRRSSGREAEDQAENIANVAATLVSETPTATSTKWWIKNTATPSLTPSGIMGSTVPAESVASDCPGSYSSPLEARIYAFISLAPPLPNRIRSGADLSSTYLGQIDPGKGLRVIDGPLCADGYSWWLVESLDGGLRGWTAEGKSSEQWVLPCPNERTPCHQEVLPTPASLEVTKDKSSDKPRCASNKLSAGMFAQVDQDSLLVVRSEPQTGEVIGRAGPMSIVKVVEGPNCIAGAVWWNVNVIDFGVRGWATENNLVACPKDSECNLGQP